MLPPGPRWAFERVPACVDVRRLPCPLPAAEMQQYIDNYSSSPDPAHAEVEAV